MDIALVLLQNFCRICHKNPGIADIFESELVQDTRKFLNIKLKEINELPLNICVQCKEIIKSVKELSVIAQKNEQYVDSLIGEQRNEPKPYLSIRKDLFTVKESNNSNEVSNSPVIATVKSNFFCENTSENDTSLTSPEKELKKKCLQETPNKKVKIENVIYDCDECDKNFPTRKKLQLHRRQHMKIYKCILLECDKSFATKGDLEKHRRTHTGERPYQCHLCDKGFAQNSTLKAHKQKIHGISVSVTILGNTKSDESSS